MKIEINYSDDQEKEIATAFCEVLSEFETANKNYPPFNSPHEGVSILKEEIDELWEEVKVKQGKRDISKMKTEAVQVAAMAIRFVLDVCTEEKGQK